MKSPALALLKFDSHRGCLPYAMLCSPVGVEEKDPTGVLPPSYYSQTRGLAFFRNRWKDADDILATISADAHNAGIGWDSCGTLGLNLLAFNTRFFGQPEKSGNMQAYSTLLVDGRNSVGSAAAALGKPDSYEPAKNGGYAIVDGGAVYQGLGCKSVKRHLLAQFASDKSQAVLATFDRLESMTPHVYTWQANLARQADDDGIVPSGGQEGGRPMSLLKGRNEGFVKGWVVHPADAAVEAKGDPLRINVKGDNVDLWVVMLAGQGAPPAATVTGSGLESVLNVAGNKVRFDAKANRVTAE